MTHLTQHLAQHPANQQLLVLVTDVDAVLRNRGFVLHIEQVVFLLRDHHHCYLSFSKIYRPRVDAYLFEALGFLKFCDLSSISAPLSIFTHPPGGFNFSQDSYDGENSVEILSADLEVKPHDIDDTTSLEEDEQGEPSPQGVSSDNDEKTENPLPETRCEDYFQASEDHGRQLCLFEDLKWRSQAMKIGISHAAFEGMDGVYDRPHVALRCKPMNSRFLDVVILHLGSEERLVFDRGKPIHLSRSFGL